MRKVKSYTGSIVQENREAKDIGISNIKRNEKKKIDEAYIVW